MTLGSRTDRFLSTMPTMKPSSVTCDVSIPAQRELVSGFARRLAASLGLDAAYPFPTVITNERGDVTELDWCADGWTPEGVSISLFLSPTKAELVFGRSLRPRSLTVALLERGDTRMTSLDLTDWAARLHTAVRAVSGAVE